MAFDPGLAWTDVQATFTLLPGNNSSMDEAGDDGVQQFTAVNPVDVSISDDPDVSVKVTDPSGSLRDNEEHTSEDTDGSRRRVQWRRFLAMKTEMAQRAIATRRTRHVTAVEEYYLISDILLQVSVIFKNSTSFESHIFCIANLHSLCSSIQLTLRIMYCRIVRYVSCYLCIVIILHSLHLSI
jgi:hypothetical protein